MKKKILEHLPADKPTDMVMVRYVPAATKRKLKEQAKKLNVSLNTLMLAILMDAADS